MFLPPIFCGIGTMRMSRKENNQDEGIEKEKPTEKFLILLKGGRERSGMKKGQP